MPVVKYSGTTSLQSVEYVSTRDTSGATYMHGVETELAGTTVPRAARQTNSNRTTLRVLWNVMFVVIGLMGFLWRRDYETWNALIAHGVPTQATIYSKHYVSGKSTTYYLDYRFYTEQGSINSSESVSYSTYYDTNPGSKLSLTYLPEKEIAKWQLGEVSPARRDEQTWKWVGGTVGGAALVGLIILVIYADMKRQLRFLQTGTPTLGIVTSGKIYRGKTTTYRLNYSYNVGESAFNGFADVTSNKYEQLTQGNPYFTVLYDSAKPSSNMPYFNITAAYLVAA